MQLTSEVAGGFSSLGDATLRALRAELKREVIAVSMATERLQIAPSWKSWENAFLVLGSHFGLQKSWSNLETNRTRPRRREPHENRKRTSSIHDQAQIELRYMGQSEELRLVNFKLPLNSGKIR